MLEVVESIDTQRAIWIFGILALVFLGRRLLNPSSALGWIKSLFSGISFPSDGNDANTIRAAYLKLKPALKKGTREAVVAEVATYLLEGELDPEEGEEDE